MHPLDTRFFRTSVVDGSGMEELREFIGQRRVAMAGSSGVGKTSLVKALVPDRTDRVRAVSERTGKGVHTTRHVEMVTLPRRRSIGGYARDAGVCSLENPPRRHGGTVSRAAPPAGSVPVRRAMRSPQ